MTIADRIRFFEEVSDVLIVFRSVLPTHELVM